MEERLILAGSGGQGLMVLGKLLAHAAMRSGKNVTYFPSYGTEVRGGTANCHVVISDEEIYSPVVEESTTLVVMNEPSYAKFAGSLAPGGLLLVNSSMVNPSTGSGQAPLSLSKGSSVVQVPATEIANALGDVRVANMVMLGAYNVTRPIVTPRSLLESMEELLAGKGQKVLQLNQRAFEKGAECAPISYRSIGPRCRSGTA